MQMPFAMKRGVVAIVGAIVLIAVGAYVGAVIVERDGIRKVLEDSLVRIALNGQVVEYIHAGKAEQAIALINTINDGNLVYLMHFESVESNNPEFVQRKRKVLSSLRQNRESYPRTSGAFKSEVEWQQYQKELDDYLKRNQ